MSFVWPSKLLNNTDVTDVLNTNISMKDVEEWFHKLQLTQEQINHIQSIPQRSNQWFQERKCRLTASQFCTATGYNPYKTTKSLLSEMVWPKTKTFKGNIATQWGTKYEPIASKYFEDYLKKHIDPNAIVKYPGLCISKELPFLGASPDGIVVKGDKTLRLLEIKCPFTKRVYPEIPVMYIDQIQGTMGLLNLPSCYFVVWTPTKVQITEIKFDATYFWKILLPKLTQFMLLKFMPLDILRTKGLIHQVEDITTSFQEDDDDDAAGAFNPFDTFLSNLSSNKRRKF